MNKYNLQKSIFLQRQLCISHSSRLFHLSILYVYTHTYTHK
uniref:Uncharacterized protein n=1 Tax=Rhizophora mucronata TaxID=61149 RepID=A0A2P2PZ71_RHIMU